ncbi:hypothetical protein GOBAR_DD11288 [Gossypium barbadense]|nr:hypothetical protein GOBAR_DD11288 [Gossypium barbadense]
MVSKKIQGDKSDKLITDCVESRLLYVLTRRKIRLKFLHNINVKRKLDLSNSSTILAHHPLHTLALSRLTTHCLTSPSTHHALSLALLSHHRHTKKSSKLTLLTLTLSRSHVAHPRYLQSLTTCDHATVFMLLRPQLAHSSPDNYAHLNAQLAHLHSHVSPALVTACSHTRAPTQRCSLLDNHTASSRRLRTLVSSHHICTLPTLSARSHVVPSLSLLLLTPALNEFDTVLLSREGSPELKAPSRSLAPRALSLLLVYSPPLSGFSLTLSALTLPRTSLRTSSKLDFSPTHTHAVGIRTPSRSIHLTPPHSRAHAHATHNSTPARARRALARFAHAPLHALRCGALALAPRASHPRSPPLLTLVTFRGEKLYRRYYPGIHTRLARSNEFFTVVVFKDKLI